MKIRNDTPCWSELLTSGNQEAAGLTAFRRQKLQQFRRMLGWNEYDIKP